MANDHAIQSLCRSEPATGEFWVEGLRRPHYTASPVLRPTYEKSWIEPSIAKGNNGHPGSHSPQQGGFQESALAQTNNGFGTIKRQKNRIEVLNPAILKQYNYLKVNGRKIEKSRIFNSAS